MVISQPVGFRPVFPNPLQASSSLGFRPDLPVSKSSSMGNRHTEPRVYQYGVGCPIHVEPRESTCGETFDKKSEGCDLQGYVARGQWPTWDLSPGTLGGSKPMSYPDRPPEVVNFVMPPSEAVSQGEGGEMGSVGVGVGCASGESTPLRTLPVTPSRIPSSDRPSKAVQPVNKEIRDSSVVSSHNRLCKVEGHDRARTNLSGVGLQEASGQSVLGSKGEVGMREAGSAISIQHMDLSEQASLNCSSMARDKASGSSFSPMLSKVQGILPDNLLRPNMALPAWAQRIKYGGLRHAQVLLPQVSSGKMSLASPASIHVSNPQYPLRGNTVDGSGKSMGSRAFPGTATSAPVCSQVQELPCKTIRDLDSASLDINILQAQGSVCGNANADPSHRPLGFSPDIPQVQGSQGSNANGAPHQGLWLRRAVDGFRRRNAKIARKAEKSKSQKVLFWQFGAKSRKAEKSEKFRKVPKNTKSGEKPEKSKSRKIPKSSEKCQKTRKVEKLRKTRKVEKSEKFRKVPKKTRKVEKWRKTRKVEKSKNHEKFRKVPKNRKVEKSKNPEKSKSRKIPKSSEKCRKTEKSKSGEKPEKSKSRKVEKSKNPEKFRKVHKKHEKSKSAEKPKSRKVAKNPKSRKVEKSKNPEKFRKVHKKHEKSKSAEKPKSRKVEKSKNPEKSKSRKIPKSSEKCRKTEKSKSGEKPEKSKSRKVEKSKNPEKFRKVPNILKS